MIKGREVIEWFDATRRFLWVIKLDTASCKLNLTWTMGMMSLHNYIRLGCNVHAFLKLRKLHAWSFKNVIIMLPLMFRGVVMLCSFSRSWDGSDLYLFKKSTMCPSKFTSSELTPHVNCMLICQEDNFNSYWTNQWLVSFVFHRTSHTFQPSLT